MANTNILPYGQTAEMPAGYPIADNLDTNSAQQALSAKQGKRLGDYLFATGYATVTLPAAIDFFITANDNSSWGNKWTTIGKCVLLPCETGDKFRITAKENVGFSYAVLTSDSHTSQSTPSYASGYDQVKNVSAGSSVDVTIPSDGKFLYMSAQVPNTETDCTPTVATEADIAEINDKIAKVAGSEVGEAQGKFAILIAAADAPEWQRAKADYVCTGVDDQDVIQSVINGFAPHGGHIILSDGNFFIDHFRNTRFTSGDCAIMLPQTMTEFYIEGATFNMGFGMKPDNDYIGMKRGGTTINVSFDCYDGMASNKDYYVFGAVPPSNG